MGGGSQFKPTDIAGLKIWLKADAGVTLVGGQVDVWADQSGNGYNYSAPSAIQRPDWGASRINEQPAIYKATFAAGIELVNNSVPSFGDLTFFFVRKKKANGNKSIYIGKSDLTGNIYLGAYTDAGGIDTGFCVGNFFATAQSNAYTTGDIAQTALGIVTIRRSGTTGKQKINNLSELSGTVTSNVFKPSLLFAYTTIGTSTYDFDGDFCEYIAYDNSISDADAAKVQAYLNTKYSVY